MGGGVGVQEAESFYQKKGTEGVTDCKKWVQEKKANRKVIKRRETLKKANG